MQLRKNLRCPKNGNILQQVYNRAIVVVCKTKSRVERQFGKGNYLQFQA